MFNKSFVLSVAELNEYVRGMLAGDPLLSSLRIRGEISNLKKYPSGHWYFTLKDRESRINCVMFRQYASLVNFPVRDGQSVVLGGNVSLYVRDGSYQFYASSMQQEGLGDLYQRYLALKDKLEREGLFDPSRKRKLPLLPRKVCVITSRSGAVLHDILNVSGKRNPAVPILLIPVRVQGPEAAGEIAHALYQAAKIPQVDAVILGRGGGSLEDLWPFNEEIVARAIVDCPIPVVSAVGHETDFTIADFCADLRAATPSQAAEFVFQDRLELQARIDTLGLLMERAGLHALTAWSNRLLEIRNRLEKASPRMQLTERVHQLGMLHTRRTAAFQRKLDDSHRRLNTLSAKRIALGPEQVLARGYVMAMGDDAPVTSAAALQPGDRLRIAFKDGTALTHVEQVINGKG